MKTKPEFDFDVDSDLFYEAIATGVERAIWRIANNATDMPCADFYDSIKAGVAKGMEKFNK